MSFIGRVYKVVCDCGCGKLYVGSTKQALHKRLYDHKKKSKEHSTKLYHHMNQVDKSNFRIIQLQEKKVKSRYELRALEDKWMKKLNTRDNGYNMKYELGGGICDGDYERVMFHCKYCNLEILAEYKPEHFRRESHKQNAFRIDYPEEYKKEEEEAAKRLWTRLYADPVLYKQYFYSQVLFRFKWWRGCGHPEKFDKIFEHAL